MGSGNTKPRAPRRLPVRSFTLGRDVLEGLASRAAGAGVSASAWVDGVLRRELGLAGDPGGSPRPGPAETSVGVVDPELHYELDP